MRVFWIVVLALCAQPALALTPEEVWAQWQMLAAREGWLVRESKVEDVPGGIRVSDLMARGEGGATLTVSEMVFTEAAGGDVKIGFGPAAELSWPLLALPKLQIESSGAFLLVTSKSGSEGFAFTADSLALQGLGAPGGKVRGRMKLAAVTGWFNTKPADAAKLIPIEVALMAGEAGLTVNDASDPAEVVRLDATIPGLDFRLTARMPEVMAGPNNLTTEDEFKAGFRFDLSLDNKAVRAELSSGRDRAELSGLACGLTFAMDGAAFSARQDCGAVEARLRGAGMPAEAVVTLEKLVWQVAAPVDSMAVPANLNMLMTLDGAALNDAIWDMVDKAGTLPRDPMSLALDLGLLARWNIFDEATTEDFKPEAMDLRRFDFKIAGVEAAFSGRGTVDPKAPEDQPFKEGVLDGRISGVNRLLNALAEAGLVAAGDLFPVRAGLSMVFNPGAGADELVTHVEQRADGSVFVNGVQMK